MLIRGVGGMNKKNKREERLGWVFGFHDTLVLGESLEGVSLSIKNIFL